MVNNLTDDATWQYTRIVLIDECYSPEADERKKRVHEFTNKAYFRHYGHRIENKKQSAEASRG